MKDASPQTIYLKDYQKPKFLVETIDLTFHLHDTKTEVKSELKIKQNQGASFLDKTLVLSGEELVLKSVLLNNVKLVPGNDYEVKADELHIFNVPESFSLEIINEMNPLENKTLDGLYKSGTIFCTQNEPEGFRRITYYIDRPDNMAIFKTKIIADKKVYPVLLSNGNLVEKGDMANGEHYVVWHDPFKKPAYLYALVAGDLGVIKDSFITMSGRKIALEIYCDKGNESKCFHAMESLKKSMKWDEERFGREYDLDIYMIVAVDAFNMGAMENKGLNIFNSAYVLADELSATDQNFYGIESVIGHEYFHNWTGNRITCRDWFQLTLKEGLTVYRDQEFSADLNSRSVERITSVKRLRQMQFAEDAGPTSHPIKPSMYIEINNFYTATVYEKGAEVIRMYETLLGRDGFRKGMDKYFELYDGQAVRTEDFLYAMSVANNNYDFSQFSRWYHQSGTPKVIVNTKYDSAAKKFEITLEQHPFDGAKTEKLPFHIPLKFALINSKGEDLKLSQSLIELKEKTMTVTFSDIAEKPILSINRGFTAPVKLVTDHTESDLLFLMGHDSDSFNRYEALQMVLFGILNEAVSCFENGKVPTLSTDFKTSFLKLLTDEKIDDAFKALCLEIPSVDLLFQEQEKLKVEATDKAVSWFKEVLAMEFEEQFENLYGKMVSSTTGAFNVDAASMGKRDLKDKAVGFIATNVKKLDNEIVLYSQFESATNMTDMLSALKHLVHNGYGKKDQALKKFYQKFKDDKLVMQKWMVVQASDPSDGVFDVVRKLETDVVYDKSIPNFVRALFSTFGMNKTQFHHISGRGYKLISEKIREYDAMNPQVASRLASLFKDYKKLDQARFSLMTSELQQVLNHQGLSKNVYEIISKTLND